MRWEEDDLLNIEYMEAKNVDLENESTSVGGRDISVVMRSGVVDPSAPSGGMLFNLMGRQ